jgi:hypothetical protein
MEMRHQEIISNNNHGQEKYVIYRNKLLWDVQISFSLVYYTSKGGSQRKQNLGFKSSDTNSIFRILSNWAGNTFIWIFLTFQVASNYAEPLLTLFQTFPFFCDYLMGLPYSKMHTHTRMHTQPKKGLWKREVTKIFKTIRNE